MTPNGKDPKDGSDAEPVLVLVTGAVIYGLMATGALFWLWSRDRLDALPARAIGEYGPLAASGIGLAVGVVAADAASAVSCGGR